MRAVYNKGTLTASNNSFISHILNMPDTYAYEYLVSVYNDGGTIDAESTDFIADDTDSKSHSYQTYGIYSPTGNVTIKSGSIQAKGKSTTYGIHNDSGTVTIGVAEDPSSQNYGRDTADVSITNPDISAIDSRTGSANSGIGVKNNTGKIYYYDGKITASTSPMPEKPTGVEYLYEPKDYTDEETGYHYRILEWMREQANN
jgi:hypothetical protein